MLHRAQLAAPSSRSVGRVCRKAARFDLSRLAGLVAALVLFSAVPALAGSTFGYAGVFDISCGTAPVAQLVPVQANRTVLVDLTTPQRFRFATFAFHGTKDNMLANWSVIADHIRTQGIAPGCTAGGLTYRANARAYDVIENTLTAMRPGDVSAVVDRTRAENIFRFGHREIAFMESRQQAFLIAAPNAVRCDPSFKPRCAIGAVVFLLNMGSMMSSTAEQPHLYQWRGNEYSHESIDISYVTRDNVTTDGVQARLRGTLGQNLPIATSIPASSPSRSSAGSAAGAAVSEYGASSTDTGAPAASAGGDIQLITHPTKFARGGRDCARYKTHWDVQECFEKGAAILVAAPAAKQHDYRYTDNKVIAAIVYPTADWREAVIARWDVLLEEYVDTGYGDSDWRDRICRTCLWDPRIQANIRRNVRSNFEPLRDLDTSRYMSEQYPLHLTHDAAARLLLQFPQDCVGIIPNGADPAWVDDGFKPPLAALACQAPDVRRVWAYQGSDDGPSYAFMEVIEAGTPELYVNARIARSLGLPPRTRFREVRPEDVAGASAAAQAYRQQEQRDEQERQAAITRGLRTAAKYGSWILAVIGPLVLLFLFLAYLAKRRKARRRATWQRRIDEAEEQQASMEDVVAEAKARLADAERFHKETVRKTEKLIKEVERR